MSNLIIAVLTLSFAIFQYQAYGQEDDIVVSYKKEYVNPPDSSEVFVFVENQAEFPGGDSARLLFIQKNIVYPQIAKEKGDQGTVYLQFIVEKDGSLTNIVVLRGVSPEIDREAVRVVSAMPKWKPAKQRGKPVRVRFNTPIKFLLSEPKEDKVSFDNIKEYPIFPGGEAERMNFLRSNVIYPQEAKEKGEEGTVYVKFIVEKDGKVTNAEVVRGVSPSLDAEAIRVISSMPNWTPAKDENGNALRVYFNMPMKFILAKDDPPTKKDKKRKNKS